MANDTCKTASDYPEISDEELERRLSELEAECHSYVPQVSAQPPTAQVLPAAQSRAEGRQPAEQDPTRRLATNVIQAHFQDKNTRATEPPVGGSRYPTLPIADIEGSHQAAVDELSRLAERYRRERDYPAVRDQYLRLSFLLNQHRLIAPAYRDQPKIRPNEIIPELLVDQIVIDCHWLWARGETVRARWASLKRIFSCREAFDCDYVSEIFAAKDWTGDFRVGDAFILDARQQLQLRQLRTAELKNRYVRIVDGLSKRRSDPHSARQPALILPVRRAITAWALKTHQVAGQEDVYEALWIARELLGPDARLGHLAELTALQRGTRRLSTKTISEKLKRLAQELQRQGVTSGGGVAV